MGRPADPTRARRQTGNRPQAGEAKAAKLPAVLEGAPRVAPVVVPDELPDEVREVMARAVEELEPRGLRPADYDALLMMAHAAHMHRKARENIERTGVVVQGPRGPMVNPMLKVARDEAAMYLRIANEYGLTLAARLRLGLMQLAGESILASLNRDLDRGA